MGIVVPMEFSSVKFRTHVFTRDKLDEKSSVFSVFVQGGGGASEHASLAVDAPPCLPVQSV